MKKTISLLCFLVVSGWIFAKDVTPETALQVASTLWNNAPQTRGAGNQLQLLWDSRSVTGTATTRAGETPLYYVYANASGKGFVIVSGDDVCCPILGYSFTDPISDANHLSPAFKAWMNARAHEISYARSKGLEATPQMKQLWANTRSANVVIDLQTADWNQDTPYNDECPLDGNVHCVTGCVNTAEAILMKYYKYPATGTGVTEAYTQTNQVEVPSRNLGEHTYNWDMMLNEAYNPETKNYTDEQAQQVATLMADLGAANQSEYSASSTGANLSLEVLYANFGYSSNMIQRYKNAYTPDAWQTMLRQELDARRPILYRGATDKNGGGGHQFLFDGYGDDGSFMVNWGWGGYCNGLFQLSSLDPYNGEYEGYSFDYVQFAFFNVYPADGTSTEFEWLLDERGIEMSCEGERPVVGEPFGVSFIIYNPTLLTIDASIDCAVVGRDGNIKQMLDKPDDLAFSPSSGWKLSYTKLNLTEQPAFGDRIYIVYKIKGQDEEFKVFKPVGLNYPSYISLTDEQTIAESTQLAFDRENRQITLITKQGVNVEVTKDGKPVSMDIDLEKPQYVLSVDSADNGYGIYTIRLSKEGEEDKVLTFETKRRTNR